MQKKLLLSLLVVLPLCAQEVAKTDVMPKAEIKSEAVSTAVAPTPEATGPIGDPLVAPWGVTIDPAMINVEYYLIKEKADVDEALWTTLRNLLSDCKVAIDNKNYELALKIFDQINGLKPENVKGVLILSARASNEHAHVQIGCSSAILSAVQGQIGCVLCSIMRARTTPEAWKDVSLVVLETIRANKDLSYDETKQLAFTLIAKA